MDQGNEYVDAFATNASNHYEFYLLNNIEDPSHYIQWFQTIRNARPSDVVQIFINCYGGNLYTVIQFLKVLQETKAHVVISVEGACFSGATMILLAGDSFEISNYASFLFHNYSSGIGGKGGEMFERAQHERLWSTELLKQIYADFLTVKEIDDLLNNKDIWMDATEVVRRLQKKLKKTAKKVNT